METPKYSTISVITHTFSSMKENKASLLAIASYFYIIPALVVQIFSFVMADKTILALQLFSNSAENSLHFRTILEQIFPFLSRFMFVNIPVAAMVIIAFFSNIKLCLHYWHQEKITLNKALSAGFHLFFFRGILLFFLSLLLWPLNFLFSICLMAPTLIVAENKKPLTAILDSLFFRYIKSGTKGMQIFFSLLLVSFSLLSLESLVAMGCDFILRLDEYFPQMQNLWQSLIFESFPLPLLIVMITRTLFHAALLCFLPFFTTTLYYQANSSSN